MGAALHDAGKITYPAEMSSAGHAHESAGEELLRNHGFPPSIARFCTTHANWDTPPAMLEDRLVALADKLWKGKRVASLEESIVNELGQRTGKARWEVFDLFDSVCERVAHDGPARLARSNI